MWKGGDIYSVNSLSYLMGWNIGIYISQWAREDYVIAQEITIQDIAINIGSVLYSTISYKMEEERASEHSDGAPCSMSVCENIFL